MVGKKDSFDKEYLIEQLMKFDLSRDEAEIYLLLLENKNMIVRDLNTKIPHIQRTYLYNYLDKLAQNGFVHINTITKPQSYNPYTPQEVLSKLIEEKKRELSKREKDLKELESKIYPKLLEQLNTLFMSSWADVSSHFKEILVEYFKDLPVRVEDTNIQAHANPYLSFFLPSSNFHGFFIAHHKKPISDEYVVHFYEFDSPQTLKNSEKFLNEVFLYKREEMAQILGQRESLKELHDPVQITREIKNTKVTIETMDYKKGESELTAFLVHPFVVPTRENVLVFVFTNKKENGEIFLEWLIERLITIK